MQWINTNILCPIELQNKYYVELRKIELSKLCFSLGLCVCVMSDRVLLVTDDKKLTPLDGRI